MRLWSALPALFSRKRLDREFDEEARIHLDLATDDFMQRGYPFHEARRLARLKFGSLEASRDAHRDSRGIPWLESFVYDFRFSLRGLARDRSFTITAVVMLALTLALNLTAFCVMQTMLFRGLPLAKHSKRLLFIQERRTLTDCCLIYPDFLAWRDQAKSFDGLAFVGGRQISLGEGGSGSSDIYATTLTSNTFGLLGVNMLLGRDFLPADERRGAQQVVILNYRTWHERFGGRRSIIGQSLRIDKLPATIIGVTPEGFDFPDRGVMWMPFQPSAEMLQRKPGGYMAVGRLARGATQTKASAELEIIDRRLEAEFPLTNKGVRARVDTFADMFIGPQAKTIYGSLWGAAWLVLMIACANLANVTLARTAGRSREFSVRLALGAGQSRMMRQIFTESLLLAAAGSSIAWWLAGWAIRTWATATATRYVVLDYAADSTRFFYLLIISLTAAILFGLIPAVKSVRLDIRSVLKGDSRGATVSRDAKRISTVLVAGQMTLAIILLVATGVLTRSLWNIVGAKTGITGADKVLVGAVSVPREEFGSDAIREGFWTRLQTNVAAIPGVESETIANTIPVRSFESLPFLLGDNQTGAEQKPRVGVVTVASDYLQTVGASLLAGREFATADVLSGRPIAMVNQNFASQYWPGLDPLSRRIGLMRRESTTWYTVVGVASNIMQDRPLRDKFVPIVYVPIRPNLLTGAALLVRTRIPSNQLTAQVRNVVQQTDPRLSLEDYSTLQASFAFDRDHMDLEHSELGKYASVAPIFAVISLLLAAVGLYTVVAHSVGQRTKEIGVRMALGAAVGDVFRLVFREGLQPVGIGLVFGLAAAFAINRILESQLVGVSPDDPATFAAMPLLLITVAVLGCHIPARRAIRVDPAAALRHDS